MPILFSHFQKYIHPDPLPGDLNQMRVKGVYGKPTKTGNSVQIRFPDFDNTQISVNIAWIREFGLQRYLVSNENEMKRKDLEEAYGPDCQPRSAVRVLNPEAVAGTPKTPITKKRKVGSNSSTNSTSSSSAQRPRVTALIDDEGRLYLSLSKVYIATGGTFYTWTVTILLCG